MIQYLILFFQYGVGGGKWAVGTSKADTGECYCRIMLVSCHHPAALSLGHRSV